VFESKDPETEPEPEYSTVTNAEKYSIINNTSEGYSEINTETNNSKVNNHQS